MNDLIKNYWAVSLRVLYLISSLAIIFVLLYQKNTPKPESEPQPQPQPIVIIDDSKIESLRDDIKTLFSDVEDNQKRLENKLQTQIEFNKRLCEYIIVITVEKKIIPRQCVGDYNWNK